MVEKLSSIVWKTNTRAFFVFGVLLSLLAGGFYFLFNKQATNALVEQMLHREQIASRAGAKSLESFFALYDKAFVGLASNREISSFSPEAEGNLEDFMASWEDTPIAGVVLTDSSGIVKFNAGRNNASEIGTDLSDRDYFERAKVVNVGDVVISAPLVSRLGFSKSQYIITVVTPIRNDNGNFLGVLSSSVILEELTTDYINPLRITDNSYEYLLNENGDVLASDQEGITSVNFFDEMSKLPFIGSTVLAKELKEALTSRQEGKFRIAYPINLQIYSITEMLVSWSPVVIGNEHLMLAVATPKSEALAFLTPYYFKQLEIAGIFFFAFLIVSVRVAKVLGYKEGLEGKKPPFFSG